jgi:hypothetical protein
MKSLVQLVALERAADSFAALAAAMGAEDKPEARKMCERYEHEARTAVAALRAMMEVEPEVDRDWHAFLAFCKSCAPATVIAAIILAAMLVAGAGLVKAAAISVTAALMHLMGLGTRRIAQLSVFAFAALALHWLNIIPLQRWFASGVAAVDRLLM